MMTFYSREGEGEGEGEREREFRKQSYFVKIKYPNSYKSLIISQVCCTNYMQVNYMQVKTMSPDQEYTKRNEI